MYQKLTDAYRNARNYYYYQSNSKIKILIISVCAIILFLIGYITAYAIHSKTNRNNSHFSNDLALEKEFRDHLISSIDKENLKSHLKYLTSFAHLAGTDGGKKSAEYVYQVWKEQGLDDVQMIDYDVYLDVPDENNLNKLEIVDQDGTKKTFVIDETIYDKNLNFSEISKPFLAYSQNGSITASKLYYLNYCDSQDFELVLSKNISLNDSVVMCRYGWSFRANKAVNAQKYGAKGLILFDDPQRSSPTQFQDEIYPNGQFLPENGTQRGTLYMHDGDPLTPNYPSNKYTHRLNEEKVNLPKIVCQVIGFRLAKELFNLLDVQIPVPEFWKGDLNVSYSIGGILKEKKSLILTVYSEKKIKKIYNVIGLIRGKIEPDRYVMVGNHRDSWTFGSIDPSSATSVLLEASRSLIKLKNNSNWAPKRTIIFLSWDAEEYGLIGSTEWVEEFYKKLTANGVVYINCDNAIQGNYSYEAKASPQLHQLLFEVTKNIQYNQKLSIFDRWLENNPNENYTHPKISSNMGSGSDHAVFLQKLGVPCIDQKFVRNKKDEKFKNIIGYPLYHTSYETFKLVEHYMDPEYFGLTSITKVISETTRVLSDSSILPFDLENYYQDIKNQIRVFDKQYSLTLKKLNITLNNLQESIENLENVVKNFNQRLKNIDQSNYYLVRQYNEQLKNFERSFLDVYYLETGSMHTLYAPSSSNKYVGNSFPGLVESIIRFEQAKKISQNLIEDIKINLSILINSIQSASHVLKDPTDFSRS